MKSKLIDKCKNNSPFIFFSALIMFFSVFFTRYLIKTDDGNFLGIISSPDFTYIGWLTERYNTLSGRTVSEFLLSFFIRQDILFWQIINALLIIYIVYFWYRLTKSFNGGFSGKEKQIFCCCGMFLMFISCLNPSVFWFSGSFTYLWPFAGFVMTVSPLVFYNLEGKLSIFSITASFFTAFIGTMQEQAAAACTATYLILLCITVYKRNFKIITLFPLIPILTCDLHIFSSPGVDERSLIVIAENFPRYAELGFFNKVFCGFATFFANTYFLSNFLSLLFIALLSITVYFLTNKNKKLLIAVNVFAILVCTVINYSTLIYEKRLPHILFRECIIKNRYTFGFYLLMILSFILTAIIAALVVKLLLLDKKVGLTVALCSAAAFFSLAVLGFSSSVFVSGQRTAFFTNMFIISACVVLISNLKKTKITEKLYNISLIYACITFALDCFAFQLFELPMMG